MASKVDTSTGTNPLKQRLVSSHDAQPERHACTSRQPCQSYLNRDRPGLRSVKIRNSTRVTSCDMQRACSEHPTPRSYTNAMMLILEAALRPLPLSTNWEDTTVSARVHLPTSRRGKEPQSALDKLDQNSTPLFDTLLCQLECSRSTVH